MRKGIVTISALVLILGVAPASFAQRPLTIRLGVHGAVQGTSDVIAIRQGYFKQERLEVDWRRFGVGREGRDAMIAGAIDINATATTPFLIGLEKGVPFSAVAVNSYFCGTNHIVVRKDSDIQSVAQLKGKRIALAMSKDGNSEIYVIDTSGKQSARLTNNSAIDVSPSWSPDGSRITFTSDRLGRPQVFIMNSDGSGVRRLTTSGSYNDRPRWSPKGDTILYCRMEGGAFQIYAINPDGSSDTRLTSEGSNEHGRWSPDGRYITFSSSRGGREAIYVMRADGSGQTRVSRESGDDSHPGWSPRWYIFPQESIENR